MLSGRDRHVEAPAKLKAFCPKLERVIGRLSCFVEDASVVWWVDGVWRRRDRYGGDKEFKHLYIVHMWSFLLSFKEVKPSSCLAEEAE